MLKRRNRLKWKDINFLLKRRQTFVTDYFLFFYFLQYPNLKFNQVSVNVPVKYSKHAVDRVALKRQINNYLQQNEFDKKMINWSYYKIFVSINKNNIWVLKSQMEKFDKLQANHYIVGEFERCFFNFLKKLWRKAQDSLHH